MSSAARTDATAVQSVMHYAAEPRTFWFSPTDVAAAPHTATRLSAHACRVRCHEITASASVAVVQRSRTGDTPTLIYYAYSLQHYSIQRCIVVTVHVASGSIATHQKGITAA